MKYSSLHPPDKRIVLNSGAAMSDSSDKSPSKAVLAIDIDEVLADFMGALISFHNDRYGIGIYFHPESNQT